MNGAIYYSNYISKSLLKKHFKSSLSLQIIRLYSSSILTSSPSFITSNSSNSSPSLLNSSSFSSSSRSFSNITEVSLKVISTNEVLTEINQLLKEKSSELNYSKGNSKNYFNPPLISNDSLLLEKIRKKWEGYCDSNLIFQTISLLPYTTSEQKVFLLPKLLQLVQSLDKDKVYSINELCDAISGFRSISPLKSIEARRIIIQLSVLFENSSKNTNYNDNVTNINNLGKALSGLKNMGSDQQEIQIILQTIVNEMIVCLRNEQSMNIDTCCLAISGLENCKSTHQVVRRIVKLLSDQLREKNRTGHVLKSLPSKNQDIDHNPDISIVNDNNNNNNKEIILNGHQVSLIASGFKGLSSDFTECRALIGSLAGRLQTMRGSRNHLNSRLTASAAVALLANLKNVDNSHPVIVKYLSRILSHLRCRESVEPLTPSDISLAISGLKNMKSDNYIVHQIIQELYENRLEKKAWSSNNIVLALSGLESINGRSGEMKRFLYFLNTQFRLLQYLKRKTKRPLHLQGLNTVFTLDMVVSSFIGLRSMSSTSHEIQGLIECLNEELDEILNKKSQLQIQLHSGSGLKSESQLELQSQSESQLELKSKSELELTNEPINIKLHNKILSSIGTIIGCLGNMCSYHTPIRDLLKTLTLSIPNLPDTPIMNELNNEKKKKVKNKIQWIDNEGFVKLIYCLKLMNSDHYEVRSLIRTLNPLFEELLNENNKITFKPFHIVKMFSGFRGLSNEAFTIDSKAKLIGGRGGPYGRGEPVCDLLNISFKVLLNCNEPISLSKICGSFYGLQSMQSGPYGHIQYSEDLVKLLDKLIEKKLFYPLDDNETDDNDNDDDNDDEKDNNNEKDDYIENSNDNSNRVTILDCYKGLYGLIDVADYASQSILSIKVEILKNLIKLSSKPRLRPENLVLIEQIYNFYSCRPSWMTSIEVKSLFEELNNIVLKNNQISEKLLLELPSSSSLATLSKLSTTKYGSQLQNTSNQLKLSHASLLLETSRYTSRNGPSELESSFFQDLTQLFGMEISELPKQSENSLAPIVYHFRQLLDSTNHYIKLKQNDFIYAYETDILLRIYKDESQPTLVGVFNIEIDGPSHQPRHKRRFSELRDQYLKKTYNEKLSNVLFDIYRISIPDTKGDFGKKKRRELLSQQVNEIVKKVEEKYGKLEIINDSEK